MEQLFGDDSGKMIVTCMSFGYKYGIPAETDLLFDVRCLPNPFYVPELREHTGLEQAVQEYVLAGETSQGLVQRLDSLLDYLLPLYLAEGKCSLVIGFGCTRWPAPVGDLCRAVPGASGPEGIPGLGEPPGCEPQPLKGGELPWRLPVKCGPRFWKISPSARNSEGRRDMACCSVPSILTPGRSR